MGCGVAKKKSRHEFSIRQEELLIDMPGRIIILNERNFHSLERTKHIRFRTAVLTNFGNKRQLT